MVNKAKELLYNSTDYYMFTKVKSLEPRLYLVILIKTFLGVLMPLLSVLLLQRIIDGLLLGEPLHIVISYVAAILGVGLITSLLNLFVGVKEDEYRQSFEDNMEAYLSNVCMDVDYGMLDKAEYLTLIDKAFRPLRNQGALSGYTQSMVDCFRALVLAFSLGSIIASCNSVVLLAIVGSAWLIRMLQKYKLKIDLKYEDMMAVIDRRYEYYDKIICDMSFGKEVRLYSMYDYLMDKIRKDNKYTLGETFAKLHRAYGCVDVLCGLIKHLEHVVICLLLLWAVLEGQITLGEYTAAMAASMSFSRTINSLIENYFAYKRNIGYLRGIKEYCTMCEEHCTTKEDEIVNSRAQSIFPIVLEDVSYKYEGALQNTLTNINLTFERGKHYAIVGENGAGKTTLVKLLLGYYLPSSGNIKLGKMLRHDSLRQACIPLFQKINMYPDSIQRNIVLNGDLCTETLNDAISFSRLQQVEFQHGLQTMLCRDYDPTGIDLSGGEQQRVALARTFYHAGNITIMDEPTSSMDATMEMHVYSSLNINSPNNCTIFVSHRMACCRFVDQVIVMKEGRVCAIGSHAELLESSKEYASLWEAQAERYEWNENSHY